MEQIGAADIAAQRVDRAAAVARLAEASSAAFIALLGKVLPMRVTGAEGCDVAYEFHWADATPAPQPAPDTVGDTEEGTAVVWAC